MNSQEDVSHTGLFNIKALNEELYESSNITFNMIYIMMVPVLEEVTCGRDGRVKMEECTKLPAVVLTPAT